MGNNFCICFLLRLIHKQGSFKNNATRISRKFEVNLKNNLKPLTMQTKLLKKLCKMAVLIPAFSFAQDANLSLGNLSSYYDTYNNTTKQVSGIVIVVGADGNNSNNYISSDF